MDFREKLKVEMEKKNINITEHELVLFEKYNLFLQEYNKKINLTAITDEDEVILKHFVDSVLPINHIGSNSSIIDVGAGAGFPSIPLKILDPSLSATMIDSNNKKVNFLNELISILQLKNITALHTRSEDLAHRPEFRESFSTCIARAVAPLDTLVEYCLPLIKLGGKLVAYKGSSAQDELDKSITAINMLGGEVEKVRKYKLTEDIERIIVIIKKVNPTPAKYPRGQNNPRISPLK